MRLFIILWFCCTSLLKAQTVAFVSKTSPSVDFTFNTMNKYTSGITLSNIMTLNIDASMTQWDLYVGATTTIPGEWDATTYYSNVGDDPAVSMAEIQFRNQSNTSLVSGFFPLTDIATPTDIIGDHLNAPDPAVNCDDVDPTGANTAGDYLSRPGCYKFNIDLRITPGLNYRAGLYTLRIDFILAPDL